MDKEVVVHICKEILLSHTRNETGTQIVLTDLSHLFVISAGL